ncbi:tyrosine-type recombinase/integrase [Acetivibrio thermocellus]|uniref:site-specific integrase n=1 Tax=Acetivibrio thermocellus TaxID=1515 RepID=UPI0010A5F161|nr:site-specific integrase [Acetivibrio thermocellus]THJ76954.1 site-specific integrase [Acetivibrio thermocellus]
MNNFYSLMEYCNAFGASLTTATYNQYIPIIREYFIPYLNKNKKFKNTPEDIIRLLKYDITRQDLIDGAKYYVMENRNVTSQKGVNNFLISISKFVEFLSNKGIENIALTRLLPFKNLAQLIIDELESEGKYLDPPEEDPPINDDEFIFIVEYLNAMELKSFITAEYCVMVKILLFLGLKYSRLTSLKLTDFDADNNTLKVMYDEKNDRHYTVHLPNKLSKQLKHYINLRNEKRFNSQLLFVNRKGNVPDNGFLNYFLNKIRKSYIENRLLDEEYLNDKNHFTPTGLIKYAIIQMIRRGINQSVIIDFTGNQEDIYRNCQNEVNEEKLESRNRYLDSKLRGIDSFDVL